MIQKSLFCIIFAVGCVSNTRTCAETLPFEYWSCIINHTDNDPLTVYTLKNVNKKMRAHVDYFLSNIITPIIKIKVIIDTYPLINPYCTKINNHSFIKNLVLLDQSLEIAYKWDSFLEVKYILFPNKSNKDSIKNNLRILDYFFSYLSQKSKIDTLTLAKLCECLNYHKFIVFLFNTNCRYPKFIGI